MNGQDENKETIEAFAEINRSHQQWLAEDAGYGKTKDKGGKWKQVLQFAISEVAATGVLAMWLAIGQLFVSPVVDALLGLVVVYVFLKVCDKIVFRKMKG